MEAGDALRRAAAGGDRRHRQRRRVRREQAGIGDDRFEVAEQLALGVEILDDRLDDDLAVGEILQRIGDVQPRDGGLRVIGAEPALLGELREHLRDRVARFGRSARAAVE